MSLIRYTRAVVTLAIISAIVSSPLIIAPTSQAQQPKQTWVNYYIQWLNNPKYSAWAIKSLVKTGKPAVPALIKVLETENPQILANAVVALGEIGTDADAALPALMKIKDNENPTVQANATQAIDKIGNNDPVAILIDRLKSNETWVRFSAAHALRAMGKDAASAVPALTETLKDKDTWVRVESSSALGSIGQAATPAIPTLIENLQDENETVRYAAAYALGYIGESVRENANSLSKSQLNQTISQLETALEILQTPSYKFRPEAKSSVSQPLNVLQKLR